MPTDFGPRVPSGACPWGGCGYSILAEPITAGEHGWYALGRCTFEHPVRVWVRLDGSHDGWERDRSRG